ncbi:MAG TPA: MASE1 domain-containing protein [Candidatus Paceibacterota bacterium]|nr:MASE1 domain-containing protein [Candidatus Paceibacterota bacterium]
MFPHIPLYARLLTITDGFLSRTGLRANQAALLALLFISYVVTAYFGLRLLSVNDFAAFVWLPTGIAIAVLFLAGYRLWPAVAAGALFINLWIGAPFLAALGIAIGNTLEAIVGTYLLKRLKVDTRFVRFRDSRNLVYAGVSATLISATIGVLSLFATGVLSSTALSITWITWWIGDALGALIIAPLILAWFIPARTYLTTAQIVERVGIFALILFMSFIMFWTGYFPYVYPFAIPLVWAAIRTTPRFSLLMVCAIAAFGAAGTLVGNGAFAIPNTTLGFLYLQLFIGIAAGIILVFSSIVEERSAIARQLGHYVDSLEHDLSKSRLDDQAKTEFLAILAHELRNPLAPIVTTLELLKLEEENRERIDMIERAERQSMIMRRLLDDLLDIARVEQQHFKLQREIVPLSQVVEQAVHGVQPTMQSFGHTLKVDLPARAAMVDVDPVRATQMFSNLLNNAAKYTPPRGRIQISMRKTGRFATVVISDNGAGIEPHLLERIFEPFVSISPSARIGTGLGIGLALTKRLTEMHGGTITAESDGPGRGSTFRVSLPLVNAAPSETEPVKTGAQHAGRKHRIVIIDDNTAAARGLAQLLRYSGHEVRVAYLGKDAFSLYDFFTPSLMLIDIGLPDIDGYEVARQLRLKENMNAKLVALTGFGQESDKQQARAAGFDHHLTKPVSLVDLEATFEKLEENT